MSVDPDDASHIAGIAIERERSQTALKVAFEETKHSEVQLRQIVDAIPQTVVLLRPDRKRSLREPDDTRGTPASQQIEVTETDFRPQVFPSRRHGKAP